MYLSAAILRLIRKIPPCCYRTGRRVTAVQCSTTLMFKHDMQNAATLQLTQANNGMLR